MTLWRLTLPDVIPEESLPFIDDSRLTRQGVPLYCLMDGIPSADDWSRVLDVLTVRAGQRADRPYRSWLYKKIQGHYPKNSFVTGAFWDADVSDMNFNISEFPSAPIFATLSRVQCVDLNTLKS